MEQVVPSREYTDRLKSLEREIERLRERLRAAEESEEQVNLARGLDARSAWIDPQAEPLYRLFLTLEKQLADLVSKAAVPEGLVESGLAGGSDRAAEVAESTPATHRLPVQLFSRLRPDIGRSTLVVEVCVYLTRTGGDLVVSRARAF